MAKRWKCAAMFVCAAMFLQGNIFASTALKDTFNFQDDPIAAMLDSLVQLKFFEAHAKPYSKTTRYNFPADSIPVYADYIYEGRLKKLDAESPFDLVYNRDVRAYIDLYTIRKREIVSKMLGLSQLYFPLFEEVLDRHNLPLELKYLAIIESALNPNARSRAGAMGLWQFMYGTGKLYNLKINSYLDERCDPYKSTVAACEYIQFLYDMFGDWQMTIAAYNCGPGAISKAIRRSGGKTTYWEIRPYLPRETQGYVPAFIAATYVMNFAGEHNLYEYAPKKTFFQVDTVEIKQQITFEQISAVLGIPVEELQYLNPGYKRNVIPFVEGEKNALCLPNSKLGSFITNEQAIYDLVKKDTLAAKTEPVKEIMKLHTVRRGEHINAIANRYKVTVADIMAWNDLKNMKLWAGQKLTIYVPVRNPASQSAEQSSVTKNKKQPVITTASSAKTAPMPSSGKYKYHTIQKGDSLWTIAQKHGTTVDELKRLNHLGKRYMLHPGMKIKVGVAG